MTEILAVTCPGGNQCSYLLPLLYEKSKFKLRLAARSQSSVSRLKSTYPNAEVKQIDLVSPDACRWLVQGATAVYHVGPPPHCQEKEIGFNMIDAAVAEMYRPGNTFRHFVYSSVLGTQSCDLMLQDHRSRVEKHLFLSPLNYTILQPSNFMDAYSVQNLVQQKIPIMKSAWDPLIRKSLVALHDLAEAAVIVLNEREKHFYARYPLCSTLPVSDFDIAYLISKHTGTLIEVQSLTFAETVEDILKSPYGGESSDLYVAYELPSYFEYASRGDDTRPDLCREDALVLILFYLTRGFKGNPSVLRWLLGREPTTVDDYVKLELEKAGLSSQFNCHTGTWSLRSICRWFLGY
ncbi:putative nucleoside-diphosphate-sugar epimerase [Camillea tinctor]|nr:putative nucleoside-diphosphate-sugar epimerase [Camillea tinctor]